MRFAERRAIAAMALGALGAGLTSCSSDGSPPNGTTRPPIASASPTATALPYHPFNGGSEGLDNPVLAVKIENTRPALPQSGVRAADIVYVEQVEGGETRLMAIYSSALPRTVGPVRSARVSDLEILRQYGRPAFAFSGVNPAFKRQIRRAPIHEISQETAGSVYFRSSARRIPYNLYADPRELLKKAPRADRPRDIGFRFGPAPPGGRPTASFTARWPSATMGFTWSAAQRRWLTTHGGRTNVAAEGGVIGPRTVVVQYTKTTRSRYRDVNGAYTPVIHTVGGGRALVLRDGKSYEARWSRPAADQGTTFTTADGRPMTFAPGQVWVVFLNEDGPTIP